MKQDVETMPGSVTSALALVVENLHLVARDEVEIYLLRARVALIRTLITMVPLVTGTLAFVLGLTGFGLALALWLPAWSVFLLLSASLFLLTLVLVGAIRRSTWALMAEESFDA